MNTLDKNIDRLADGIAAVTQKLADTAPQALEVASRAVLYEAIGSAVAFVVFLVACIFGLRVGAKVNVKERAAREEQVLSMTLFIICGFSLMVVTIIGIIGSGQTLSKIAAPEYHAVMRLLGNQ
jgi:hypothetical protein